MLRPAEEPHLFIRLYLDEDVFKLLDYLNLHVEYQASGKSHAGVIVSRQMLLGEVIRRLLRLLNTVTADEMRNQLWWLGS